MTNEEAYQHALKQEADREYIWRQSEQGAFESEMDFREGYPNPPDASDGGYAVRRMVRDIDRQGREDAHGGIPDRKRCISRAAYLVGQYAPECLCIFWAVIRNGTNRKESIWQLMREWAETPPLKLRKRGRRQSERGKRHETDTGKGSKKS